jgi:hypothetical protein
MACSEISGGPMKMAFPECWGWFPSKDCFDFFLVRGEPKTIFFPTVEGFPLVVYFPHIGNGVMADG